GGGAGGRDKCAFARACRLANIVAEKGGARFTGRVTFARTCFTWTWRTQIVIRRQRQRRVRHDAEFVRRRARRADSARKARATAGCCGRYKNRHQCDWFGQRPPPSNLSSPVLDEPRPPRQAGLQQRCVAPQFDRYGANLSEISAAWAPGPAFAPVHPGLELAPAGTLAGLGFGEEDHVDGQKDRATGDGGVGHVEHPGKPKAVEIEEIRHGAETNSVDHVAKRAADNEP